MSERNGTMKFFDQYGNDIEDSDADLYEETDGDLPVIYVDQYGNDIEDSDVDLYEETDNDVPVIYVENQNASWTAAKFSIEVEKLRNLHDINVDPEGAERVFERTIEKARREELSHPNWSEHTTWEDHPEWFKGWNIYFCY